MTHLLLHSLLATQLLSATPEETRFLEAITKYDVATVRALLKEDPSLAQRAKTAKGSSALAVAAYVNYNAEYFYPPAKNQVLQEVMRRAPPADAFEACLVGDLPRAKAFLDKEPDAIRSEKNGWTLLHAAAFSGNVELVKLLISRGAVIDAIAKTYYKNTPLEVAMLTFPSTKGQSAVARALVEAGADANFKNDANYTVLHDAARQGNVALARFFLKHGADVTKRTPRGETAVISARSHGHLELAAELEKLASAVLTSSVLATNSPAEDLWLKCRGCHGMDGKANTKVGVKEKIPDLTSAEWQTKMNDEGIRKVIADGPEKNPKMKDAVRFRPSGHAYKEIFTSNEIASLIPYIRNFRDK